MEHFFSPHIQKQCMWPWSCNCTGTFSNPSTLLCKSQWCSCPSTLARNEHILLGKVVECSLIVYLRIMYLWKWCHRKFLALRSSRCRQPCLRWHQRPSCSRRWCWPGATRSGTSGWTGRSSCTPLGWPHSQLRSHHGRCRWRGSPYRLQGIKNVIIQTVFEALPRLSLLSSPQFLSPKELLALWVFE